MNYAVEVELDEVFNARYSLSGHPKKILPTFVYMYIHKGPLNLGNKHMALSIHKLSAIKILLQVSAILNSNVI